MDRWFLRILVLCTLFYSLLRALEALARNTVLGYLKAGALLVWVVFSATYLYHIWDYKRLSSLVRQALIATLVCVFSSK